MSNFIKFPEIKIELNQNILQRQQLTEEEIRRVKKLYLEKNYLEAIIKISDINELPMYGKIWFNNEKKLQKTLKFQNNDNFIKFWTLSQCSCNPIENEKKFPNGGYEIDTYCLIHGIK